MHQYKLTTHFMNQKWNIPQISFDKSDKYDTLHVMGIIDAFASTLCKTSNCKTIPFIYLKSSNRNNTSAFSLEEGKLMWHAVFPWIFFVGLIQASWKEPWKWIEDYLILWMDKRRTKENYYLIHFVDINVEWIFTILYFFIHLIISRRRFRKVRVVLEWKFF